MRCIASVLMATVVAFAVCDPSYGQGEERGRFGGREWEQDRGEERGRGRPGGRGGGFSRGGPGGMMSMRGMTGSAAICATEKYVYVVRGNTLYQFESNGLKLIAKTSLEEMPEGMGFGRRGEGREGPPREERRERVQE